VDLPAEGTVRSTVPVDEIIENLLATKLIEALVHKLGHQFEAKVIKFPMPSFVQKAANNAEKQDPREIITPRPPFVKMFIAELLLPLALQPVPLLPCLSCHVFLLLLGWHIHGQRTGGPAQAVFC
jgi:hypothetical protein